MPLRLPSTSSLRRTPTPTPPASRTRSLHTTSSLSARLIPRPHRPYTFTQLLTLSDGSTFLHRTTSPVPVYRSTRDARNTPLWNPSNAKMANSESDEAGRLRAFRRRFGRGWDAQADPGQEVLDAAGNVGEVEGVRVEQARKGQSPSTTPGVPADQQEGAKLKAKSAAAKQMDGAQPQSSSWTGDEEEGDSDNLMDLISEAGSESARVGPKGGVVSAKTAKAPKSKKK